MANTKIPAELSSTPGIIDNSNATAITIDSSENVGIGTSSITNNTLGQTTYFGNSTSFITGDSSSARFWLGNNWYYNSGDKFIGTGYANLYTQQSGSHEFLTSTASGTAGAAATFTSVLKIDSSGNLLVGTTSTSASVAGGRIFSTGRLVTSVNNEGHYFRRNSSDGTIVEFAKDGTTVGKIGSRAGLVTNIILDPRSDGAGLTGTTNTIEPIDETGTRVDGQIDWGSSAYRFKDLYLSGGTIVAGRTTFGSAGFWDASGTGNNKGLRVGGAGLYPTNGTGTALDATIDIGTASARFKDLYLSGGVHLGGTGSANKLDDYEEGTWTPVLGPGSGQAYGNRSGNYTKVGRMVTAYFGARLTSGSFTGGEATITGLPFAAHTTGPYQEPQFVIYTLGLAPTGQTNGLNNGAYLPGQVSFYISSGETQGRGRKFMDNTDSVLDANEVFDSNTFIKGVVIYYTL